MEYSAVVCKITVRPHPDADRLQIGTVCCVNVIVGLDTKEGDIGLYFAPDGQLSEEFAEANDLVGKTDPETGKKTGGYFGKNRRVRAQKFRGVNSYGFWIPLDSLKIIEGVPKYAIDKLKEGDCINQFYGFFLCNKYITPATMKALKSKVGVVRRANSLFAKHFDTEHLIKYLDKIPYAAVIYLSEKLHGTCLISSTCIRMADGTRRKIIKIKKGDKVLGYKDGKVVETLVLNTFNNGHAKQGWIRLHFTRRGGGLGSNFGTNTCTPEHLIYSFTQSKYVEAQNLQKGEKVGLIAEDIGLSYFQEQLIMGKLLGDGHLTQNDTSAWVEFSHKKGHKSYIEWLLKSLCELANPIMSYFISGFGSDMVRAKTKYNKFIKQKFGQWINKRSVPNWVSDELGPLALAVWYMDDGSLGHSSKQKDRANIAICSLDECGVKIIQKALLRYGLNLVIYKSFDKKVNKAYYRLRFNKNDANRFWSIIAMYIPECMQYKLPIEFRGWHRELPNVNYTKSNLLKIQTILSVAELKASQVSSSKYDIQTETHNFFANDLLVHNSGRTGYVLENKEIKQSVWKAFCNWLGGEGYNRIVVKKEYTTITGTRNVILKERLNAGFYGNNEFRGIVEDKLKGFLKKGEIVYYEIVGYTTTGRSIMPSVEIKDKALKKSLGTKIMSYTYGCKEKECEFYVYRITNVNEDGLAIDLSWLMLVERCKQLGVKHVPNLSWTEIVFQETNVVRYIHDEISDRAKSIIYNEDAETLLEIVKTLVEGRSIVDARHIREGVVIRVESAQGIKTYKYKSHTFLVLEGLAKDKDTYIDMEESA